MMPRIRVQQSHLRHRSFHWNCEADHMDYSTQPFGWAPTIAAAADAGRKHLAEHHAPKPEFTPVVQTIIDGTRCTCADLPSLTWPYFKPCPVHSWLQNTTTTTGAPTVGTYCRAHGVGRDECGCIPAVMHATPERLAKVDMAPDYPNAALARLARHATQGTGMSDPLDKAHNEGSR